jgi:hypothetical protein
MEDGLAMINKFNADVTIGQLESWTNAASLTADNWETLAANVYHARRYVSVNNWGTNYYDVYVTNLNNAPIVSAVGVTVWKLYSSLNSPLQGFAAVNSPSLNGMSTASRKIKVQTAKDSLFAVAMATVNSIDMNGNNIRTDSFDSADPLHSIGGLYPAGNSSMVKSNGDICTDGAIIDVGQADIYGKAKTGPGGNVSIGANGFVTGGVYDDFNVSFPSVTLPADFSASGTVYNNTTVDGTTYSKAILSSGDYQILTGLSGSLYIASNVTVRIKISGTVNLTGHDSIKIDDGAKVKMYVASSSFSIGGNGVVNDNGNADSFQYYGLPGNTSLSFGGNGGFTGCVYAPQAAFSLGGGGNNTVDFIGASVSKSVTMNGHFNFHYDENLRRIGPGRGYVPVNWTEVANK